MNCSPAYLDKPLQSLWGFAGEVRTGDDAIRRPCRCAGFSEFADPGARGDRVGFETNDLEKMKWH